MQFDASQYPYASRREVVYGRRGMVCTSQTLAAQAGLDMLKQGGNAVDAALATAISLVVLEPTSNGLGSDAFALIWTKGKLHGLNGSGWSPQGLTWEDLHDKGCAAVPHRGWTPVMVPGAPAAWAEIHEQFGKLPFEALFEPAIYYAEHGYAVMPNPFPACFPPFSRKGGRPRPETSCAFPIMPRRCACSATRAAGPCTTASWPRPSTPGRARPAATSARTIWQNTSPSGSSPSIRTTGATTCGRFRLTATAWSC